MGVTIHYRGTMDDISQVETMEDRLLDLVFLLGGRATIWRSFADHDSLRVVRGLIVNLEPGQETFSLLVSPEGHLTPLIQIEDAAKAPFDEPPYCSVKTQFGSLQGHIAIVHLLDAIQQRFCSNLEVSDEGEYYENRDVNQLSDKLKVLRSAINSMAEGWKEYGLSAEAAEDPSILATRIERIAALVQQKVFADRQSPFVGTDGKPNDSWSEPSLEDEVANMDRLRLQNDLRSERMTRRIAEATATGLSAKRAFELAMEEEGLPIPTRELDEQGDCAPSEPWIESLPSHPFDEADKRSLRSDHPAVAQAEAFLMQVTGLEQDDSKPSSYLSMLARASMEMLGGLVQATIDEPGDNIHRALTITQLKRALSGHAYARGAIFGLRSEKTITEDQWKQLHQQCESLHAAIHELFEAAWT